MKLSDLQYTPQAELPSPHALFRVQVNRARPGTQRAGRILLPPSHLMNGRFDLSGERVAYFAEAPETAVYESLCRREQTSLSLDVLKKRNLLCFQTRESIALLDLRPHVQTWPVMQSLRIPHTQELAAEALAYGFAGVIYRSAQQAGMDCFALFGSALSQLKFAWSQALVEPGTGNLHGVLADALRGSKVPLTP